MSNLSERNFRVLKEIKNMELINQLINDVNDPNSNMVFQRDVTTTNETHGVLYNMHSRVRYFCECGYVGSTLDVLDNARCQHCDNISFTSSNYYSINHLNIMFGYHSYVRAFKLDIISQTEYSLKAVIVHHELVDNDAVLEMNKSVIELAKIKDGEIKFFDSAIVHLSISNHNWYYQSNLSLITIKDAAKLLAKTPAKDFINSCLADFSDNRQISLSSTLMILATLSGGFKIINDDERYSHLLGLLFEYNNVDGLSNYSGNVRSAAALSSIEEKINKHISYLIDLGDTDAFLKDIGYYKFKDILYELIIKIELSDSDIKRAIKSLSDISDDEDKEYVVGLIKSYKGRSYLFNESLDSLIMIMSDPTDKKLFKAFAKEYADVYPRLINAFQYRKKTLLELAPAEAYNESLYVSRAFYSLVSMDQLRSLGFPESKIVAFDLLIEDDPLKAYSLMSSKRNLTKKQEALLKERK